jgi:hypothetical protein
LLFKKAWRLIQNSLSLDIKSKKNSKTSIKSDMGKKEFTDSELTPFNGRSPPLALRHSR